MVRRYRIDTPEQLLMLEGCLLKNEKNINSYATVWSAARRGNSGRSKWDEDFSIRFETDGRKAYIDKNTKAKDAKPEIRRLNYNKAVAFCRDFQLLRLE